jgi:hypothetical protein
VEPRRSSLLDWWSEATWIDYVLTAAIVGIHILVITKTGHGDWLKWISSGQRVTIYGTGATIVSIIGGLSAVAVSVYLAAAGERARAVRRYYSVPLRRNWLALLSATVISAGLCLVAQALDVGKDPHSARFIFEFAMALATFRFIRLIWIFNAMVTIADKDLAAVPREPAPDLSGAWSERLKNK